MKKLAFVLIGTVLTAATVQACHTNPLNTANPVKSQARDTSVKRLDTSSASTRIDR